MRGSEASGSFLKKRTKKLSVLDRAGETATGSSSKSSFASRAARAFFSKKEALASLLVWLLALCLCAVIVARTTLRTDMAAFLPRSSSIAQQALTDQVNNGAAAHLVLLGIQGAPPQVLARLSRDLASRLRRQPAFIDVENGDEQSFTGIQRFVWTNRYLLSPGVMSGRFTQAGLHAALENDLGLLGSDMGAALQASLAADPTGEALRLAGALAPGAGPPSADGIWLGADGTALSLVHTAAPGFDIDRTQSALALISQAFAAARGATPGAGAARLAETGPGVFAVHIRDTTRSDVTRLSILATAGAVCLLLFAYRSPIVLLLGLLPVATGALAATAAVALAFGFVHGITLGFGVTLIGESLDYAIYLFTQTAPGETPRHTLARIWPTLRLGAATSVVGFSAMLFSSFVGFAQLGLFSITGLAAAACVTRFVLPHLMPRGFFAPGSNLLAKPLLAVMRRRNRRGPIVAALALAATAAMLTHRGGLWDGNLANLSPIPQADQALDQTLRHDLGVSDQRYFAVFQAADEQKALQESEALGATLQNLATTGKLGGFDVPSATLPSARTQRARQDALPDAAALRAAFTQASANLPFRPDLFAPFFADVAQARAAPLLTQSSLPPALQLRLQSMLLHEGNGWTVIAPLTAITDPAGVAAALAAAHLPGLQFVDLDQQSANLLRVFQTDAWHLATFGSLAILAILLAGLRAPRRVAAVAAPLAAAVIVTAALLTLGGGKLSIFMVVGFLLIIAVGSNYCLFFELAEPDPKMHERAIASITLANLCTVSAYGLMSLSRIPVLHDIGMTVAIGTFLSLIFGAALSARRLPA
jgi:predicted exporter